MNPANRACQAGLINLLFPVAADHDDARTTGAVLVRAVRRGDHAGWLRLWADYHAYGRNGATSLPDSVTEATWERFLHRDEQREALVADLQGRLVGIAHMIFHASTSSEPPVCFLQDLFVDPTLHGCGIGRSLMEAVYIHAGAAGARRVYWHVLEANARAVRLYDKVASRSGHVVYRKDL